MKINISEDFVSLRQLNKKSYINVIFPVTRLDDSTIHKLVNILSCSDNETLNQIIVIDKTADHKLTDLIFSFPEIRLKSYKLTILQRPQFEPIYKSQSRISLQYNGWISQIHDDDEITGKINLPTLSSQSYSYTPNVIAFYSKKKQRPLNMLAPARFNFSLVPKKVWDDFVELVKLYEDNVPNSFDATLRLVTRFHTHTELLSDYTYLYNMKHWSNKYNANKALGLLAQENFWDHNFNGYAEGIGQTLDSLLAFKYLSLKYDREFNLNMYKHLVTSKMNYFHYRLHKLFHSALFKFSNFALHSKFFINIDAPDILLLTYWRSGLELEIRGDSSRLDELLDSIRKSNPRMQHRISLWRHYLLTRKT
jgi:hypothetical protein